MWRLDPARLHGRYERQLADLPWHGLAAALRVQVRRFVCEMPEGPRRIVCERLAGTAAPHARRTTRLRGGSSLREHGPPRALELGESPFYGAALGVLVYAHFTNWDNLSTLALFAGAPVRHTVRVARRGTRARPLAGARVIAAWAHGRCTD